MTIMQMLLPRHPPTEVICSKQKKKKNEIKGKLLLLTSLDFEDHIKANKQNTLI